MKKLGKALSLMLTLAMVIMSLPTLASADGEVVQTYYSYSEALSFDWGGAGVTVHPWNANVGTLQDAYGTKVITDADNKKSIKLGMNKRDTSVSGSVSTWNITKEGWRKDPTIYISGISGIGFMHFKVKLEGLESAKDLKVYFRNRSYQETNKVLIPNGANITSDGAYHDVYVPLGLMMKSGYDASKDIIEAHFNCLNTAEESYVYVRGIEFCSPNAVAVKAVRNNNATNLTWEKIAKFTADGYKILRDGVEIDTLGSDATSYTDAAKLAEGRYCYTVVPYTGDTLLTTYASNEACADVEHEDYKTAYTPAVVEYVTQNGGEYDKIYKQAVCYTDKNFIPAGSTAAKYPVGTNVGENIGIPNFNFAVDSGAGDFSAYQENGVLNLWVYIDAPDTELTQYDSWFNIFLKNNGDNGWKNSAQISLLPVPLNQWKKISVPLSKFTGVTYNNIFSVSMNVGKSQSIENCDVYVQGLNITVPAIYCDEAIVYDADNNETQPGDILFEEPYTVKMTLHNDSSSPVTPVYIVAVYDNNGAMKAVYMPEAIEAAPAGESKTYSVTLTTPVEDVSYTIKGFMLKSFNTLTPFIQN